MATKAQTRDIPRAEAQVRWLNEPLVVLAGYGLLVLLINLTPGSLVRSVVAGALAILGSGYSLTAALYPRPEQLDGAERAALATVLSLAEGGISGFLLAYSVFGLTLSTFLFVQVALNFTCFLIVVYRRRGLGGGLWGPTFPALGTVAAWWTAQRRASRWLTIALVLALAGGLGALYQAAVTPAPEPTMTEFFLLGDNGKADAYPTTAVPGQRLTITYGIVNHEAAPAVYQVRALLGGDVVGKSQPVQLAPGDSQTAQVELLLPQNVQGENRLEVGLYRDGTAMRWLYLWLNISGTRK